MTFSGPPCEGGGGGWGSGFGGQGEGHNGTKGWRAMWCNKNTKGREREDKVGAGCSDPCPVGLARVGFAMPRQRNVQKKWKIVLFRLFITRILIWNSGRNRGSFGGGGGGVSSFHSECIHD